MRCSTSSEQINDRDSKWTNKRSKSWSRSWSWSYYFQKVKNIKYRNWRMRLFTQSGKNGVIFFVSLHIWFHFHQVENVSALPLFPQSTKNQVIFFISWYAYIYIYIAYIYYILSFHYHEVDYVLPMLFVYTRWKNFNDLYYFQKLYSVCISTKWKKWSNSLYLFIYLILFPWSAKYCTITFYSQEVQITTWFSWLLYISPMHFISRKWEKVLMIYLAYM